MASEDLQEVPQPLEETSLLEQEKEDEIEAKPKQKGVKFSVGDETDVNGTKTTPTHTTKESPPSLARVKRERDREKEESEKWEKEPKFIYVL